LANILVVDDDEVIRTLTRLHLTNAGYRVELAEDAVEAGRILYDARLDLLIIDVEMPYLNGLEFAALMMDDATVPQIPIILITSHERFREQAQIIGVDCLIKPFFADQLLEAVARRLERKTSVAVVP